MMGRAARSFADMTPGRTRPVMPQSIKPDPAAPLAGVDDGSIVRDESGANRRYRVQAHPGGGVTYHRAYPLVKGKAAIKRMKKARHEERRKLAARARE